MKPKYTEGDKTPLGTITDILPVLWGSEPMDYIYEIDGDYDQRYTTSELGEILDDLA